MFEVEIEEIGETEVGAGIEGEGGIEAGAVIEGEEEEIEVEDIE